MRIQPTGPASSVPIVTAAAALPFPPVSVAVVPRGWTIGAGTLRAFDLKVRSLVTLNLTGAELYGAEQEPITLAAGTVSGLNVAADTLTITAHGYLVGDGPLYVSSTVAIPAGLNAVTAYYAIVVDANTIKLATSVANTLAGIAIDITSAGSGTITVTPTGAYRIVWYLHGVLATSIALLPQKGYAVRCSHRPATVAYAIVGTLSTGTVSAAITPVSEI